VASISGGLKTHQVRVGLIVAVLTSTLLAPLETCTPQSQLVGHLIGISKAGSGCQAADSWVLGAGDASGDEPADEYGEAAIAFERCAKSKRDGNARARLLLYGTMAADQAANRYDAGDELALASGAASTAREYLRLIDSHARQRR